MPGPDQRDALNASPRSVADPVSEAARTSNTRGDADRAKPRPILRPALEMARCGFLCRFIRAEGDQSKARITGRFAFELAKAGFIGSVHNVLTGWVAGRAGFFEP
jgi:hypothetical protein